MVNKEEIKQQAKDYIDRTRPQRNKFLLGKVFPLLLAGFFGASLASQTYRKPVEIVSQPPQPTVEVVDSVQTVEEKVEKSQYDLILQPFYFNPIRDGQNCNDDCRYTRTEVRVLEDDYETPFGPFWWDQTTNEGGVACPIEFLGSTLEAKLPNGEKAIFHCFDTGRDIVAFYENGQTGLRIDVLFEDGYGPNSGRIWNHPVTAKGYKLTDDLRLEARVLAQP